MKQPQEWNLLQKWTSGCIKKWLRVDSSALKQVFLGGDTSWQGKKHFIEFCNQDSFYLLYEYSIIYKTLYCQYCDENNSKLLV